MVKCFDCSVLATHYVSVIYDADQSFPQAGTQHSDDFTCPHHIGPYISSHDVPGITVIEVTVKKL